MRNIPLKLSRFVRCEKGSYTLETTLLFPFILIATLVIIFMVLYVYQNVFMYSTASMSAERASFAWGNSHKIVKTGELQVYKNDGLYWRIGDFFSGGFGLFGSSAGEVAIPSSGAKSSGIVTKKLSRTAADVPTGMAGNVKYVNHGLTSYVEVQLNKPFRFPFDGTKQAGAMASSYVTDPTEFIRIIDLTRSYIGTIKDRIKPNKANAVFKERGVQADGKELRFASEKDAASYIGNLVGSTETNRRIELTTSDHRKRMVDAFDKDNIAHQVYYTTPESQIRSDQFPKDVDLLKTGKVSGVVYYFFKTGNVPSPGFRAELEREGIRVVIY
ncbi:hypothetical protein NV379_01715 [Paenibacillus sp. N1-5-1-14]|uniref:TadE/TadG family type IV pilus assembly protein n=1 Tax=Paenibacillus radicibacter TaxID=2972488 RepID=UPI0021592590|nr:hypothetical protein [Paenibacillus radicibacter]MCR8641362.1 hypothetical protein [Paenibacillus radicibacter]